MSTKELKSEFHKLIDTFEDEIVLNNFYEAILEFSRNANRIDIIDELSDDQRTRLIESIKQVSEGKMISNDAVKDEIQKWLTK